uniref:dTDP-4-dehydrorhamnose reductase n=1 Tax=Alistipes sp. TaxID=1872444 RepID=UPI00405724F9
MLNILVTGANGQLGREMRRLGEISPNRYLFTDIEELDITCREAVEEFVEREEVDVIVNCAAYTQVDRAEEDEAAALILNRDAVENLALAAKRRGATLIHVSTDYVFGGEGNRPRTEEMEVNPLGVYGRTKWEGEQVLREVGCRHLIFRTAWLYSEYGNNFLKTMLRLTAERKELKVVFDQVGTPTYAGDLAIAIFGIVESEKFREHEGTYHFSNEGVCSWYDFAVEIAREAGHTACEIHPCHSHEYPSKVERPAFSVLDKTKFKHDFGIEIPHWREAMVYCLKRLKMQE